ncbi:MAG: SulP family inorganic anion transporter, partial [Lutimonas sp.]
MSNIKEKIPILQWLPGYQRSWFKHDLFAGLTVGIILIPQGIAYATIAGLPPIYGLYTALIPQIVYAVMGTSRQLSVGPAAMDSLIVASGVGALATMGSENFIAISILLAFLVGLFQFLFGLFHLGFLVNFLSRPVISGFTSGSAIIIGLNQIGNLTGMDLERSNQVQFLFQSLFQTANGIHWPSMILGGLAIVFLLLMKRFFKRVPASLMVVIIGIAVMYFLRLNDRGIDILGFIPSGLPPFQIPDFTQEMILEVGGLALTLALIGFLEAISIAKSMESKHNSYQVSPNQELIAIGLGNMAGSFFQTYPATGGFSRTAVNDESGAKTPMSSLIAALVIALTLLFLTPLFYYLPTPILAAIIVISAYGLLDFSMPKNLLSFNRRDLIILN